MPLVADIAQSWRAPGQVMRRHLARGRSEPFAFALLVVFLLVSLIARWPMAARIAALDPGQPAPAQMLPFALGGLAAIPLLYALAAAGTLAARALGARVSWYGGRLALFWALAASTPLVLLTGLVGGLIGQGGQLTASSLFSFAGFALLWALNLRAAGQTDAP